MAFPAFADRIIYLVWVDVAEAIKTASTLLSLIASSGLFAVFEFENFATLSADSVLMS